MKVCHLTSVHPRDDGRIFKKECISLQQAGYDVSLIVADGKGDEENEGIKIYDVGIASGRLYRMLQTTHSIYRKAALLDADVYHFHDPELIPVGLKLKKQKKTVIFDSHEDVPQQIKNKKYIPALLRIIIQYIYTKYEIYAVKKLDAIISVTPQYVERLRQYNANTVQITNYPALKEIIPNQIKPERSICYFGLIAQGWMQENILEALLMLKDVKYTLAGYVHPAYLQKLKDSEGWKFVNFMGVLPQNKLLGYMQNSIAGMALYDYLPTVGYKTGTLGNNKLFEYMLAGIPVICTDFVLWKQIVEGEKCGICVNPRDVSSIANAIKYILDNPEKAREMGKAGQKAVKEKYNWPTQESILINLYKKL
jgi:glycosyltransferase involved in cell wall biosynthesis